MIEIRPHVYVGHVNARIRDRLWEKTCRELKSGSVVQIWNAPNEQGFSARSWGSPDYVLRDFDGLLLIERPPSTFDEDADQDGLPLPLNVDEVAPK